MLFHTHTSNCPALHRFSEICHSAHSFTLSDETCWRWAISPVVFWSLVSCAGRVRLEVRVCTAPAGCEADAGLAGRCIAVYGTTGIALCLSSREWLPVQPSGSRVQVGLYPWQAGSGALPCSAGCWTEPRKWNSVSGWRAALSGGVAPREGHRWLCLPPLLNWLHDLGEFSYPCCILLIFWRCMLFLHFDISEIRVHFTNIIP